MSPKELTAKEKLDNRNANAQTVRFRRAKNTKNAVQFQEVEVVGAPKVIGALYVQKWAVGDAEELEVTVRPLPLGDAK